MSEERDVIVIGAGAAGLAAAHELRARGANAVVLESRDRVGGRAWTSYDFAPHAVELGAEFIHGENVATWDYLRELGLHTNDQMDVINVRGYVNGALMETEAFVRSPSMRLAWSTHDAAAAHAAAHGDTGTLVESQQARTAAEGASPTDDDWRLWTNFLSQYHATSPDRIGAAGYVESTYDGDGTRLMYRIVEGYSALMDGVARDLEVRLSSPVERVEWTPDAVRVSVANHTFEARAAIVTLPLALLQRNAVAFEPALPAAKRSAIDALGAGVNGKILLRFDERWWPDDLTFLFTTHESQLWWRPGRCRDGEAPVLTAFFGGPAVEYFRGLGEDAPSTVLRHLEEIFGTRLERRLRAARFVDWGADPHAMMSYSYVPPGALGQRAVLAAPVGDVVYFAGEATSLMRPATVHGALESGRRAASEALTSIAHERPRLRR